MMDTEALLTALASREYYSLPLRVTSRRRGADLTALAGVVQAAVVRANQLAEPRNRLDPTSATGPDIALKSLTLEIDEGSMEEAEVLAWLTDFAEGLAGEPVKVAAQARQTRIPWKTLESWHEQGAITPTAFLFYTAEAPVTVHENGFRQRALGPQGLHRVAAPLADWARLPGGTAILMRGLTDFICPPGRTGDELAAVYDAQLSLREYTLEPRRHTLVDLTHGAQGTLQWYDDTIGRLESLEHLLDGLRTLAPFLDHAYVRMDIPVLPHPMISTFNLGRQQTEQEQRFAHHYWADDYVVGPHVAQVLNPSHLAKLPDLSAFTVEELPEGRALVVARDASAWVSTPEPGLDVLGPARLAFAPMTFTLEDYARERDARPH